MMENDPTLMEDAMMDMDEMTKNTMIHLASENETVRRLARRILLLIEFVKTQQEVMESFANNRPI